MRGGVSSWYPDGLEVFVLLDGSESSGTDVCLRKRVRDTHHAPEPVLVLNGDFSEYLVYDCTCIEGILQVFLPQTG